jgi:maleylacetate reductase
MTPFAYDQPSGRIVFGAGSLDPLPEEVERLGARCALVLSTPEQTRRPRRRHAFSAAAWLASTRKR